MKKSITVKIPGDKSISHRAVILGSIAQGTTVVRNFLDSEDCLCTKKAFEAMGVSFELKDQELTIHGKGLGALKKPKQELYMGNSGTSTRLLAGFFAGLPFEVTLTGDESLNSRPMKRVINPLKEMGAEIEGSAAGTAPLVINRGSSAEDASLIRDELKLKGINYKSPVASAQVKSCLLLAGLNAEGSTSIREDHLSRNHSELMLKAFGAELSTSTDELEVTIKNLKQDLQAQNFSVPGDISSAAFFMAAAAIQKDTELCLRGVGLNASRTGIIDVLKAMKINYSIDNARLEAGESIGDITIRSSKIQATEISGELIPRLIDEIPIIAILAAQAEGATIIKDAQELRVKESDRIKSTVNLLKALGVAVEEQEDGMIITGRSGKAFEPAKNKEGKTIVETHGDHRIAMSAAIAELISEAPIEILQKDFVNTSFPNFFELLKTVS